MKKKKNGTKMNQVYSGILKPGDGDVELDSTIVSATEMTGAVPAKREDPVEEELEAYIF